MSIFLDRKYQDRQQIDYEVDRILDHMETTLVVDGVTIDPDRYTVSQNSLEGTTAIAVSVGIRDILKRHPREYSPDLHDKFFTDEERIFFENYRQHKE